MQVRSGPSKLTNHHLNRTRQLVGHLLPLGPRTVTMKTPPRWADGKSLPHTEPLLFQPRNMYTTADVLRRFGRSIACKEVWIEAACTRWLQAKCGVGARIEHEIVAQCAGLRCLVQPRLVVTFCVDTHQEMSQLLYLMCHSVVATHSKIISDVPAKRCSKVTRARR